MPTDSQQILVVPQQLSSEVKTVVSSVLHGFDRLPNFQKKSLLEDIITFFSIICAYQYVSLSYRYEGVLEEWTNIEISNTKTQTVLLLIFAIYFLTLKIVHKLVYIYETAPAKKIIPENWEEMEDTETTAKLSQNSGSQKPLPSDSFTTMIEELLTRSIYGFVFILCTTAYTYMSVFNKKFDLVNLQQANYLIFWFVSANIFFSIGKIFGKLTRINTFHHFGLMVGIVVLVMEIGLAHGINMFAFV